MNTIKNVCLFILLIISITFSQDLQFEWAKTFDYKIGGNIDNTHDNGYIFTAQWGKIININEQSKIKEIWIPYSFSPEYDPGFIQKIANGYISFSTVKNDNETKDITTLKKIDTQGQIVWEKYYYNENYIDEDKGEIHVNDYSCIVKQTNDNGYILLCLETRGTGPMIDMESSFWLIKTDQYGEKEWDYWIDGDYYEGYTDQAIHQTSDGGYLIAYNNDNDGLHGCLTRLTPDGQEIWHQSYNEYIQYALPTDNDGYFICGNNYSTDNATPDTAYLKKVDKNGDEIWKKTFQNISTNSYLKNMIKQDENSYLLCGNIYKSNSQSSKGWLIKTDNLGNKLWEKTFTEIDNIKQILIISKNEYILFGDKEDYVTLIRIKEKSPQDTDIPELLDPVNNKLGAGTQLNLDWTSVVNASSYLLEIDDDSDMSSPVISKTVSNSTNCIIDSLSHSTLYYWRVRAQLSDNSGNWSNISTFTTMPLPHIEVKRPEDYNLSYVDIGDQYYTDREFTITKIPAPLKNCIWIKTQNKDKYLTYDYYPYQFLFYLERDATVYIAYDDRASSVPRWLSSEFKQTEYTVETSDGSCNFNIWENTFSAGYESLGGNLATGAQDAESNYFVLIDIPLQMLDPKDNKTGVGKDLIFSWEQLGNYGNYDLQISEYQDMASPLYNITDIEDPGYLLKGLDYNKDYYWRIKAHNRNDENAWYHTQKFQTMTDPSIEILYRSNYVLSWLEENDQYYVDRTDTVLSIPHQLKNLLWIKTANDDAQEPPDSPLGIQLEKKATLYVGIDSRATSLPNWVTEHYNNTGLAITVSDSANELNIWTRNVDKGLVELGPNMAEGTGNIKSHYIVLIDTNQVQPVAANFGSDVTLGVLPLTANFSDSSQGFILSWAWDFGDGTTSTEQNPTHTYENAGSYTVSLTVNGLDESETISKENYITVAKKPEANFSSDITNGFLPLEVNFVDKSMGIISSWFWNFGDGVTSTEQNPTHTFEYVGSFTISLTVSGLGATDTVSKNNYIVVTKAKPIANFGSDITKGLLPLAVNFADSSKGPVDSWLWHFGDGTTFTEQNPSHNYENAGIYTVSLTVSNQYSSDTITKTDYITVYETTPAANFGSDKISGYLPLTVNFSDSSHGIIESWLWDFGDGAASKEQNPSHTYENAGSYTVSLTVSNQDSSDTITKENYIKVKKATPIANFSADVTMGIAPLTVSFTDSSLGEIDTWLWKFGDGLTSTSQNPTHVYTSADTFTVSQFVRGPGGSNTKVKTNYIIIDHPTSINDMAGIPEKFDLLPNYPNPFNPQTTIRFAVPQKSYVNLTVYDINGKQVQNLFSGIKSPGNFSITWNASGFPSGMYLIKMDTDTYSSVKKCILVK